MNAFTTQPRSSTPAGWLARLELSIIAKGERSVLRRGEQLGPLRVQRPFYPEGDCCHVYILHPPGGVVGGDSLEMSVEVEPEAVALLTTPASSKIYRSAGLESQLNQTFSVANHASLEWLPQDQILFGGSRLKARTTIYLAKRARFFGWDLLTLGRPRSGDTYTSGTLDQQLTLLVDLKPHFIERHCWQADDEVLTSTWGLAGARTLATALAYPADEDTLAHVRSLLHSDSGHVLAATLLGELLVIRLLGFDAVKMHRELVHIWQGLRSLILQRPACAPRIWVT